MFGRKNRYLTRRKLQYITVISTSRGVLHTEKKFFSTNSRRDMNTSAAKATANVRVDNVSPMMVRYWKCQP